MIVITSGAALRSGQTRLDLLKTIAAIVESIVADIVEQGSEAVLLVSSKVVAASASRGRQNRVARRGVVPARGFHRDELEQAVQERGEVL